MYEDKMLFSDITLERTILGMIINGVDMLGLCTVD
jgi:hypothetical protein